MSGDAVALDVAPLANAVQRLREGLRRYERDTADEQIRDGLIQRFEFTYELSHRTLKRFLAQTAASPGAIEAMSFAELIRTGNEQRLLRGDWPAWRRFREMRVRTSYAYDAAIAREVVAGIPEFLPEAEHLCRELQGRLA